MMPTIGGSLMDPTSLQSLDPKTMSADQEKQLEALSQLFNGPLGGGPLGGKIKEMMDAYHTAHPDTQQA
ncbi:hypothetical protein KQH60_12450 [Mycetohabitans sp. B8]|uniref:hypothetical protein n=1 Tax=Mycetohabitans sp. B8 TaxID=2841845 RepID=UPI001F2FB6B1|nr:hypothetical protein [Mycetohabitans sp. B8]MCG1043305.1 hypothetical protein [Mycetohabitans sp. B8]